MPRLINVGVVGYGYWGPNLVRNFGTAEHSRVAMICEAQSSRAARAAREHPGIPVTRNFEDLLADASIDLIACATPVSSHHRLGKAALKAGKHLLLEKPMTSTSDEAAELIDLAQRTGVCIFVDHTYVFTPAVQRMKELLRAGDLGSLYYYDSTRINLGLFQRDVNVVWDLAPHDLSILDFLLDGALPTSVACAAVTRFGEHAEQAYVSLTYPDKFFAHIHVNWLSPVKTRQVLLGADARMIVYDDIALEKLRIYDRGVRYQKSANPYEHMISYRDGDMWAPRLEHREALSIEVENVLDTILGKAAPIVDGSLGHRVVRLLEIIDESILAAGRPIVVNPHTFIARSTPA